MIRKDNAFESSLPSLPGVQQVPQQTGEIIAATYHTYNSIGVGSLAPLVHQDENLSLTINSKNVKIFFNPDQNAKAKNLMCFLENTQTTSQGPDIS